MGDMDPIQYMVPWTNQSPQPKCQHRNRISHLQGTLLRQTDRLKDHATQSVTIGRIYVRSTAMRPNNY